MVILFVNMKTDCLLWVAEVDAWKYIENSRHAPFDSMQVSRVVIKKWMPYFVI
jgi:hypothetical protein